MLLRFKDDKDGGSIEGEVDLSRSRFNPLESWIQAGEVLKSTNPRLNSGHPSRPSPPDQGIPTRLPEVPYTPPQSTPPQTFGVPEVPNFHQVGDMGSGGRPVPVNALMEDGTPNLRNEPRLPLGGTVPWKEGEPLWDFTGPPPNAFEGYPPPTTAYGSPPLSGGIQEPTANFPPPGYPSDIPTAPPYSTPTPPPNTGPPGMQAMPTAAEGQDAQVSAVEHDWNATMEQAQVPPAQQAQQNAVIGTSAQQNNGSSTVGGSPASDDPAMQRQWGALAYDPTKRKEEYTKRMNTIFMQAMLLDVAARTMGVPSRAGAFMEHSMKVLEGEMKFDDQQRLYEITQGVFYPNGAYDPPRTQREGFERAMRLGATAEEAAAISGYMPDDQTGFDTYYKANPDGSVQTIYVPKGQAPPEGATDASGIATHNADINNPDASDVPTAMEIETQVNSWMSEADSLEAAGDKAGADALRQRADNLLALGGGKSKTNEYSYAQANSTFNSLYGGMMRETGMGRNKDNTMRDANGNFIPWGVYRQKWLTSWDIDVTGKDGVVRKEPGWLQISAGSKVQELPSTERIAQPSDIAKLREAIADGNEQAIPDFIEYFGADQLPDEFKAEGAGGGW